MHPCRKANHLTRETSPYLRQHALNPVDWYPWGEEALERARREDRPIFLSIGYSACHWCHVMERESFENEGIAELLNDLFVNIKVDREERPDLDRIYMAAVQMITGSGGWPMSVFLTPDRKPFFGGTYFPPDDRYGRPGYPRILRAVAEAFRTRRDEVEQTSATITGMIQNLSTAGKNDALLSLAPIVDGVRHLSKSFDVKYGGFGAAPKFPSSIGLQLLLRQSLKNSEIGILRMVRITLDRMAAGGICDQVGGGFHRYSTDERWLVPHFEKMLYDNALLTLAFLEAFQLTGEEEYSRVARETLDYVIREMTAPGGGFYSTQDADSGGREGVYYTWTPAELQEVLGAEEADLFSRAYDVDEIGNFEGRSVPHRVKGDRELATMTGRSEEEIRRSLSGSRARLLEARESRAKPHRDEKILVDWNGLALSAFARGSRVLQEPRYREAAERAAQFLLTRVRDRDGGLLHVWTEREAKIDAFLEDYANLLVGLIDLYETSGNLVWLQEASTLRAGMIGEFWDEENGGFFDASSRRDDLIARTRRPDDGSTPSGNSMAVYGMIRLARIQGDPAGLEMAARTLRAFSRAMRLTPGGTMQMLLALDLYLADPQEIVLIGAADHPATQVLRSTIDRLFLPHTVLLHGTGSDRSGLPGLRGKVLVNGKPAAYVCTNLTCREPVTTPEDLRAILGR